MTGIGFGTWSWGNQLVWGYDPDRDDPELAQTLQVAVQGGLSLVDTADSYGTGRFNGRSERLLGSILQGMDPTLRDRLTVATKLAPFPWRLGRRGFDRAFLASHKRLAGHLHRVQLHWSTARYAPWQEVALLDGLADLVAQGRVAELGVSNLGPKRLRSLHARLAERGVPLRSVQVQLSLLAPDAIQAAGLKSVCADLGIDLLAYSPLALGVLTVAPGDRSPSATRLRRGLFRRLLPATESLRRRMAGIAKTHQASQAQVALNWCRAHDAMPLPGLRRVPQARDAVAALDWTLSDSERQELDALALAGSTRMPANPFMSA
ncbi:MAG: aldo/keto reductase [Synechococcus sp.]